MSDFMDSTFLAWIIGLLSGWAFRGLFVKREGR